jgi:hypothetical protein
MSPSPIAAAARAALCVGVAAAALAPLSAAQAEPVVGLTTTNALLTFDSSAPANGSPLTNITGLQSPNERILSIDLRPTTGLLYGVSTDDKVYSLTLGGTASFVGALTTPLGSDVIGIDFNPVADLGGMASLRIVSSTGQNLAFNVATGTTTPQSPIQANVASVAYSNNDVNPATGTALYYVDTADDTLKVATSAFNAPTITTVGALGFNANGVNGLDISPSGASFAAMTDANTGKSGLYGINLANGAANFLGEFGIGGNTAVAPPLLGLTVAAIPEPETYALMLSGLFAVAALARQRRNRLPGDGLKQQ